MIAVMTAIFGGIDKRKQIPAQTVPFEEFFFDETDSDLTTKFDNRTSALYFKSQGHKITDAEIIIWVDGKVQIMASDFVSQCIKAMGTNSLAIMKHGSRKCIYEEVDYIEDQIVKGSKYLSVRYASRPIRSQVEFYRSKGYPKNNGLNDCCVICRRNIEPTNLIFDEWWTACKAGLFDQTAIQYIAWKNKIPIQPIIFKPGTIKHVPHIALQ